jgi:hypothetical protein
MLVGRGSDNRCITWLQREIGPIRAAWMRNAASSEARTPHDCQANSWPEMLRPISSGFSQKPRRFHGFFAAHLGYVENL